MTSIIKFCRSDANLGKIRKYIAPLMCNMLYEHLNWAHENICKQFCEWKKFICRKIKKKKSYE